jgi:hypothetical protein
MLIGFEDLCDDDLWNLCSLFRDAFHLDSGARKQGVQLRCRAGPIDKIAKPIEGDVHRFDVSGL